MEPRPNAIIGAFYSHDGCNVFEPFTSQSCEAKTRPKNALRRKQFFSRKSRESSNRRMDALLWQRGG